MLFNRDLRIRDHPALHEAINTARTVIPLFVIDGQVLDGAHSAPNRVAFLLDCLRDLRAGLSDRGGNLVVARGDPVDVTMQLAARHGAEAVFVSADVSRYAARREQQLAAACDRQRLAFSALPGVTVVPPHELRPAGGDHYRIFTPYWRRWSAAAWRDPVAAPSDVRLPPAVTVGPIPTLEALTHQRPSPELCAGGETVARASLQSWGETALDSYREGHDDLAGDATSRLSPYLHFGCVSPLDVALRTVDRTGGEAFLRQLCWRDFHHQVTASFPAIATAEYRPRGDVWRQATRELEAWQLGRTGYPIVDAGMRQLQQEGWMHNRARMITASFLTKHLYIDWRLGARHFLRWLVDGDIANNAGNWQWVAGCGNDTRPNRVLNPLRQAERFDPNGDYVRRYVPELATVAGPAVHRPWDLDPERRALIDYPAPIIDHTDGAARFRRARSAA
ncbi:MAG: deoxyribodipyrimidine photo-lyase [Acidimicrobiia bacterium]